MDCQTVYPRVCGGTLPILLIGGAIIGLSPRVRGNPYVRHWHCDNERSIPACAGEPAYPGSVAAMRSVYPRVCGGTLLEALSRGFLPGLSPRVRGNPYSVSGWSEVQGSIPACAGEPKRSRRCRQ